MIKTISTDGRVFRTKEFWDNIRKEFLQNRLNGMKWRDNVNQIAENHGLNYKAIEYQVLHRVPVRKKTPPNLKKVNNCKISA